MVGYVFFPAKLSRDFFVSLLKGISFHRFPDLKLSEENEHTILVALPKHVPEIGYPGGFYVIYHPSGHLLMFPRSYNLWDNWAQSCIQEQFAVILDGFIFDDHSKGMAIKPWPRQYKELSFRVWLSRGYPKPMSKAEQKWVEYLMTFSPIRE